MSESIEPAGYYDRYEMEGNWEEVDFSQRLEDQRGDTEEDEPLVCLCGHDEHMHGLDSPLADPFCYGCECKGFEDAASRGARLYYEGVRKLWK